MDTATTSATDDAKIQHVTKKSSDELLMKFAELGSDEAERKIDLRSVSVSKRRKKKRREYQCDSPSYVGTAVVERRSLLPLPPVTRRSVFLRQLRASQRNKSSSLMGTIQKTWRRTVEGASRVFMEKQYHRHKRLINDIV
ncbi:uncharacterized protein LOC133292000 [Gastrolobium bilobum]|uniref:uncharacterized protein LOC133292000 n=1 Tax=Gastrolobium bilobum TaxID=150636 RepID=UPI002AB19E50|nr:uncharacterized protein LOC133292000 [Gastrolobium bilobum]